jgi:DNA-binding NarL/FixJ family response regulator
MQSAKIRLLIADDHEMLRCGLRCMLADTEVKIVAEVATGQAAVKYVREYPVDVALLDTRMPNGDGLTALGQIKLDKPDLPVLMFSAFDNPTYVARAVALGAAGYLLKTCGREELLAAIGTVASGKTIWTREQLRRASGALATARPVADIEVCLTQREMSVLRHIAAGLTNKQIAPLMQISCETVKEHVQHLLQKIGVTDRTQAAVWAVRKGLIENSSGQ